jgi:hypothetical protein
MSECLGDIAAGSDAPIHSRDELGVVSSQAQA